MANTVPINLELELSQVKAALGELTSGLSGVGLSAGIGSAIGAGIEKGIEKSIELVKEALATVAEFMKDSFNEAVKAVKIDTVLETSIRNAGAAATFTAEEIKKIASIWQDRTTFDDESIKKAASGLINLGIAGDNLLDAIKTSQDLAAAMGGDLASSAETLGKALANPERAVMLLRRAHLLGAESAKTLGAALDAAGTDAEKQRAVLDTLNATYHGQAEALAANAGAVEQLTNQWHDMQEEVGKRLLPLVNSILPGIKYELKLIGEAIVHVVEESVKWFSSWGEGMGGANNAAEKFVAGLAVIGYNFDQLVKKAAVVGLAIDSAFHPSHAKENLATVKMMDAADKLAEQFSGGLSGEQRAAKAAVSNFRDSIAHDKAERAKTEAETRGRKSTGGTDESSFLFDPKFSNKANKDFENRSPKKDDADRKEAEKIQAKFDKIAEIPKKFLDALDRGRKEAISDGEKKNAIEERIAGLQAQSNKEAKDKIADGFRFQARIESGSDVFRRIQTAAASHDPAKGTESNTKKTADEIVKLRQDIAKINFKQPARAG